MANSPFYLIVSTPNISFEYPLPLALADKLVGIHWSRLGIPRTAFVYTKPLYTLLDMNNIYLVQIKGTDSYKMEYKCGRDKMLKLKETISTVVLEIVATCPGDNFTLAKLENKYGSNKVNCDWFSFSDEEVKPLLRDFLTERLKYPEPEEDVNIVLPAHTKEKPTKDTPIIDTEASKSESEIPDTRLETKEPNLEPTSENDKSSLAILSNKPIKYKKYKGTIKFGEYLYLVMSYIEKDYDQLDFYQHINEQTIYPLCGCIVRKGQYYDNICSKIATNIFSSFNPSEWRCSNATCQTGEKTFSAGIPDGFYKYFLMIKEIVGDKYSSILTEKLVWDLTTGEHRPRAENEDYNHKKDGVIFNHIAHLFKSKIDEKVLRLTQVDNSIRVSLETDKYGWHSNRPEIGLINFRPSPDAQYFELESNILAIEDKNNISIWSLYPCVKCINGLPRVGISCARMERFTVWENSFLLCHNNGSIQIWNLDRKICIADFEGHLI